MRRLRADSNAVYRLVFVRNGIACRKLNTAQYNIIIVDWLADHLLLYLYFGRSGISSGDASFYPACLSAQRLLPLRYRQDVFDILLIVYNHKYVVAVGLFLPLDVSSDHERAGTARRR